ncbi:MAG TPA: CobW family GTP-binding protein [Candidatus Hydrogenedentes bacterium]|nr:CobW family GTP-binding protein [Candidatus Hydrogenedentota bacterium]HPJ98332.1 CobW family GTP-binding protein [Candidatus Hydrogenedentota bacterium]
MIALSLITGFLGSGKTTYLRRLIEQYRGRRLVFLVNEFSPLDVDGPLLQDASGDVVSLPGGSIFCTCLVSQFVSTLKGIPERFGGDTPVEGVIIEASGIANPNVAVRMLRETGLDAQYALRSIVSIVDPGTFPVLLETLPNLAAQIEASSTIIVNKVDLFDEKAVEAVEEQIRRLNSGARVVRSTYCDVALDLLAMPGCRDLDGDYAPCADPNYARFTERVAAPLDETRLRAALTNAERVLYRVKGFVPGRTGSLYLDYSSSGLVLQPAGAGPRFHELVIIASAKAYAEARSFVESLKHGEFNA